METNAKQSSAEKPTALWNRVYIAVVFWTILVIAALWAFSRYFE